LLLRLALAGIFLYAGIAKLVDPAPLATTIMRFQLLPLVLVNPLALALPPLEIICACALLAGRWKRQAAFGICAMCTVFLIALVSAAARGIEVDCTCFGAASAAQLWQLIIRDCALLGGATFLYLHLAKSKPSLADELNDAADCRHSAAATKSAQLESHSPSGN
jgi:uncharacterized membrane protein YphA (DoxX/SURF4 family)